MVFISLMKNLFELNPLSTQNTDDTDGADFTDKKFVFSVDFLSLGSAQGVVNAVSK